MALPFSTLAAPSAHTAPKQACSTTGPCAALLQMQIRELLLRLLGIVEA